jgi:hypothetical protein
MDNCHLSYIKKTENKINSMVCISFFFFGKFVHCDNQNIWKNLEIFVLSENLKKIAKNLGISPNF